MLRSLLHLDLLWLDCCSLPGLACRCDDWSEFPAADAWQVPWFKGKAAYRTADGTALWECLLQAAGSTPRLWAVAQHLLATHADIIKTCKR